MANNKIVFGNTPLIDLTSDTAIPSKVANGVTFMGKNGVLQTGTMMPSGASVSGTNLLLSGGVYTPPSWSTGSGEGILKAITLHRQGWCDLTEYWSIGDEREIELSDENIITLALGTPFYGGIFSLVPKYATYKNMYMGTTSGTYYTDSSLRPWCNTTYYDLFPQYIKDILLPSYDGTDYFYIPSVDEAQSQMGIRTDIEGVAQSYWTREKPRYDRFYAINTSGNAVYYRGNQDPACAIPLGEI